MPTWAWVVIAVAVVVALAVVALAARSRQRTKHLEGRDVSVDHPDVVEHYRQGHKLAVANVDETGDTESLRRAMRHYRALFEELVRPDEDAAVTRDAETGTTTERTVQR